VKLISLQKGPGSEQLRELGGRFDVMDLADELDASGPFLDTAAVMANLDVVVSIDSALAHLAGAMGAPAWLALAFTPDWRWLLGRDDSPWYPTLRLFRQDAPGAWAGVFERIAAELGKLKPSHAGGVSVSVETSPGELIDRITILQIKSERLSDESKLKNVRTELASLQAVRQTELTEPPEVAELAAELKAVNEGLWQTEDELRLCEKAQDFGPRFVDLARSVYKQNDRRSEIKRAINERLGSRIIEEKSYGEQK
jgi:hypothetical protein